MICALIRGPHEDHSADQVSAAASSSHSVHSPSPAADTSFAPASGGKDSCYNMVLCTQHGHEVSTAAPAQAHLAAAPASVSCTQIVALQWCTAHITAALQLSHVCRLWLWQTWHPSQAPATSWTATCTRRRGTSWWAPTRSAWPCPCSACTPADAPAPRHARALLGQPSQLLEGAFCAPWHAVHLKLSEQGCGKMSLGSWSELIMSSAGSDVLTDAWRRGGGPASSAELRTGCHA